MYALTDTAELAAELSAVDGVPLTDALGMAAAHLQRLTRADPPAEPDPGPLPPIGPYPARVNISDRLRCSFCTGPHADAECPLRRPVFVGVSAPDSDPADRPVTLYCESLDAEIVDWRGGYVLRGRDEDDFVTVSFGGQIWHLTLEQARELRALVALPQVRRLLTA